MNVAQVLHSSETEERPSSFMGWLLCVASTRGAAARHSFVRLFFHVVTWHHTGLCGLRPSSSANVLTREKDSVRWSLGKIIVRDIMFRIGAKRNRLFSISLLIEKNKSNANRVAESMLEKIACSRVKAR